MSEGKKHRWIQAMVPNLQLQRDGEYKHYLKVRSFTPVHNSQPGFDQATFDSVVQFVVEHLRENPGYDGADFEYVEPSR